MSAPGHEEQLKTSQKSAGDAVDDGSDNDDRGATNAKPNERPLTEDIFSLIYIGTFRNPSFHFAVFIFLFQLAATILITLDLIDSSAKTNHLRVPVSIHMLVFSGKFK